ncbi:hypothetical protein, partial [Flavobacterium agri]|uniref:hypothetical protein n=1 Tax=Flavobacterium agri TaxID=2743471 RepID=UPI001C37C6D3
IMAAFRRRISPPIRKVTKLMIFSSLEKQKKSKFCGFWNQLGHLVIPLPWRLAAVTRRVYITFYNFIQIQKLFHSSLAKLLFHSP